MNKTKRRAILAIIICTFFMAIGATMFKIAADTAPSHILEIIMFWPLYQAIFVYALGAIALIWGLKHGELSVLYPIVGLNFGWTVLIAFLYLGEPMNAWKWAGTISLLLGVAFMGQETFRRRWKQVV